MLLKPCLAVTQITGQTKSSSCIKIQRTSKAAESSASDAVRPHKLLLPPLLHRVIMTLPDQMTSPSDPPPTSAWVTRIPMQN